MPFRQDISFYEERPRIKHYSIKLRFKSFANYSEFFLKKYIKSPTEILNQKNSRNINFINKVLLLF